MQILVHEFVTGGGLAGRPIPVSLAREGSAMAAALVADLAATGEHRIVVTADRRFPFAAPRGVEVVTLSAPCRSANRGTFLDPLMASVDAVWIVAPETGRCLERLTARVERHGKVLLGSSSAAIGQISNKATLPSRLARLGVAHPRTCLLRPGADYRAAARDVGYPLVVKPARGAGCGNVYFVRDPHELNRIVEESGAGGRDRLTGAAQEAGVFLLQRYVDGVAASVSLLADGQRVVALTLNAQSVHVARTLSYRGGRTPFDHPLADQAIETAIRACRAVSGLRGFVGVDLVLTTSGAVVIEVNPRLTTAYLGVRAALAGGVRAGANVAAMALAACEGRLPPRPTPRRAVRFTAGGRIFSTM